MTEHPIPTRILQVHNRYRKAGGEDIVVDAHRDLLEEAGCQVHRFEVVNPEGRIPAAVRLGVAPWNPMPANQIRSVVRNWRPQVAHVHNTWFSASPSVIGALRAERVPTVMTLHNYRLTCINAQLLRNRQPCHLCVGNHPWRGVQFRCYRGSLLASAAAATTLSLNRMLKTHEKGVNRFLVFTSFQRDLMIEAGIRPEKLELVPNFVADPGQRDCEPEASDILLYVGRLSPEKGVDQLIDAWARVMPAELRMVVVGDGPLRSTLAARRVPGVELRGWVSAEEVRALMLKARALLFPTIWYEGQPMVLLEALASGLPVVAPRIGAVASTLDEAALWVGDAGWEAALKEVSALSDAQLSSLSRAARRRYLDEFTPADALSRLAEVYWNVLEDSQL